jgi:hypothetical protein
MCWRQFDIFHDAAPLTATTGKLALQPIVNLGRLAIRGGDGNRAYRIFQNAYDAVTRQATRDIDGRDVDFRGFVAVPEQLQALRRFLWTILLADGTRALTTANRWDEALQHLNRYKGIGSRMLDGRQVAILARCANGDVNDALEIVDASSTLEPWEDAVAACLRTLCLRIANQPAEKSLDAMVNSYLRLEPTHQHVHFRTRLGLTVIDLTANTHQTDSSQVIAKVTWEAATNTDAHSASEVLAHDPCRANMTRADHAILTQIVDLSGLRRGKIPPDLLDDLMTSVKTSEAHLAQTLRGFSLVSW